MFSTVSLSALVATLTTAGFAVGPADAWGQVMVAAAGSDTGPGSLATGAIAVTVTGSTVDNQFALRSARSAISETTETAAVATITRWLAA